MSSSFPFCVPAKPMHEIILNLHSTSLYPISHNWKTLVVCHTNKKINSNGCSIHTNNAFTDLPE
jgi:hypothetical protein